MLACFRHGESVGVGFACVGMRKQGLSLAQQIRVVGTCKSHCATFCYLLAIGKGVGMEMGDFFHCDGLGNTAISDF